MCPPDRETIVRWSVAALALPLFAVLAANHLAIVDDAFITFRYAEHWVRTGRLTWHDGLPMVDGYTSLVHVMLLALGIRLGFDPIDVNTFLNLACVAGLGGVYIATCRRCRVRDAAMIVGLYLIAINSGLAFWVAGGLDGVLWTLGIAAIYLAFETGLAQARIGGSLACTMVALVLIRPEGTFIVMALLLYLVSYARHVGRLRWSTLLPWLGLVVAGTVALYVWRFTTYGHLFPNAFYAKAAASRWTKLRTGIDYVWVWFAFYGGVLSLSAFLALRRSWFANTRTYFVLGLLLVVALEGGDPQQQMRFLLPLIPLLSVQVATVWTAGSFGGRILVAVLVMLYAVQQFSGKEPWHNVWPLNASTRIEELVSPTDPLRTFARGARAILERGWPLRSSAYSHWNADAIRDLAALLRRDVSVAATDVGALAYYSGLMILDVQGLNHPGIAHLPKPAGDRNLWGMEHWDVALASDVDVIIPGYLHYADIELTNVRMGALTESQWVTLFGRRLGYPFDRIAERYTCVSVAHPSGGGRYLNFMVERHRRDRIWQTRPAAVSFAECW